MMMGFSLFAVVPSLIYLIVPIVVSPPDVTVKAHAETGDATSATSMIVTIAAAVMWCLGVWKSQFLDSNWILFGIETVVVLLVCIGAAYGLGALLSACFPNIAITVASTSTLDAPSEL